MAFSAITPEGYIVPVHPNSHSFDMKQVTSIKAIIFAITSDQKVILIMEEVKRDGISQHLIQFPSAIPLRPDIDGLQDAAERVLLKQTGYKSERVKPLGYTRWVNETSPDQWCYQPFIAFACARDPSLIFKGLPNMKTLLIPIEEWFKEIESGENLQDNILSAISLFAFRTIKPFRF